jgi:hypothetical protein
VRGVRDEGHWVLRWHELRSGQSQPNYGFEKKRVEYLNRWDALETMANSPAPSPSAVTGKYLAVWEKMGNNRKLECRFEDQWARHWEKIHRQILGEDHRREQGDAACRGRRFNNRYQDSQMEGR